MRITLNDAANLITDNDDEIEEVDDGELDEASIGSSLSEDDDSTIKIWPVTIGIFQLCIGFVTAILGTFELFVLPIIHSPEKSKDVHLGTDNCFGAGLLAGFFMILTGSSAIRASISKRSTSVRKFFSLTLFTLALYTGFTILIIVGYARGWTKKDNYKDGSFLYEIHIFLSVSTLIGLLFCIAAFVQYYEVVFLGEYQLLYRWVQCLCPWYSKVAMILRINQGGGYMYTYVTVFIALSIDYFTRLENLLERKKVEENVDSDSSAPI